MKTSSQMNLAENTIKMYKKTGNILSQGWTSYTNNSTTNTRIKDMENTTMVEKLSPIQLNELNDRYKVYLRSMTKQSMPEKGNTAKSIVGLGYDTKMPYLGRMILQFKGGRKLRFLTLEQTSTNVKFRFINIDTHQQAVYNCNKVLSFLEKGCVFDNDYTLSENKIPKRKLIFAK